MVTQEADEVMMFEAEPDTSSSDSVPDVHQEHSHTWGSLVPPNRRLMQDFSEKCFNVFTVMYVCMYAHVHAHLHTYMEISKMPHEYVYLHTCMQISIHACMYVHSKQKRCHMSVPICLCFSMIGKGDLDHILRSCVPKTKQGGTSCVTVY